MTSADDLVEQTRRELLAAGVRPREVALPWGYAERAEATLAAILAPPSAPAARAPRPRPASGSGRRARWRLAAVALGAVAVLAIALGVLRAGPAPVAQAGTPALLSFAGAEPGTLPDHGKDASGPLRDLAAKARTLPSPGDGPVQHLIFDAWWSTNEMAADATQARSAVVPLEHESFVLPDGTHRSIERRGEPLDQDGRIDPDAAWARGPAQSDESLTDPHQPADLADRLPTDVAALEQQLAAEEEGAGCEEWGCRMSWAINVLGNYVVSPAHTATFWEVLADDPLVSYLGTTKDRLGRRAAAFMSPQRPGLTQQLLFIDPATGAYLGSETVLIAADPSYGFTPPAVTQFDALVLAERTDASVLPPESETTNLDDRPAPAPEPRSTH